MLADIATALTVLLLLLNCTGLALGTERLAGHYGLAKTAGPILAVTGLFWVEHFVGLGSLDWLWPLTTAGSTALIWKRWPSLRANWRTELLFAATFGFGFVWRYCFPDIDGGTEKLADLALINTFSAGGPLPPTDSWLPPYPLNVYYGLQHHGAALLGRLIGCSPGIAYNLAVALSVAIAGTAAGGAAILFATKRRYAVLPLLVFLAGGTGAVPFLHFMEDDPLPSDNMRFIGGSATPEHVTKPFGQWLVETTGAERSAAMELPAETFAYLVWLGDYHPMLSGFCLLALGLFAIALAERKRAPGAAEAVLGATVPLAMAANPWTFPLQASLAAAWAAYRAWQRAPFNWRALAAGAGGAAFLVYPFLLEFGYRALDYDTHLRWVAPLEHTPLLPGLIVFYPVILVLVARLLAREKAPLAVWLALYWLALLLLSELLYIDDIYAGAHNRFNTTLKWWPWIYCGALLSVGTLNLGAASKWCRGLTMVGLVASASYVAELGRYLIVTPKPHAGRIDGAAWIEDDPIEKALLRMLRAEERGIVLQRLIGGAFVPTPGVATHAGQPSLLGWPSHERLWRGDDAAIGLRESQIQAFYDGKLADSGRWLADNGVDHVLWLKGDNARVKGAFERIHEAIEPRYLWRELYRAGELRVGVWSRRGGD